MFTDFYRSFYYTVIIIAAGFSLICFRGVNKANKWLCILIILTLISELVSRYFSVRHKPNGIIYILFTPVEFCVYAIIYSILLNDKLWTRIICLSVLGLVVAEIFNTLYIQHLKAPTNIMNAEGVLLVILSLKLFINIKENPVFDNLLLEGVFWFNTAVLIYYSFDILIWGLHSLIYFLAHPPVVIYHMLLIFSALLYLLFAFSILLNRKNSKNSSFNHD